MCVWLNVLFITQINNSDRLHSDTGRIEDTPTLKAALTRKKPRKKPLSQRGGTCCRLGRKESMEIGVCIKLPLLSHVGRAQEREEAK